MTQFLMLLKKQKNRYWIFLLLLCIDTIYILKAQAPTLDPNEGDTVYLSYLPATSSLASFVNDTDAPRASDLGTSPSSHDARVITAIANGATGMGEWQYKPDMGAWTAIPLLTNNVFTLASNTRVRYAYTKGESAYDPDDPDVSNALPSLTLKAWDGSGASDHTDMFLASALSANVSSNTYTHATMVLPTPDMSQDNIPLSFMTGTTNPPGFEVSTLGELSGDIDTKDDFSRAPIGRLVRPDRTTGGVWQYFTDGGTTWTDISLATDEFLPLNATDSVRFAPTDMSLSTSLQANRPTLLVRAWNSAALTARTAVDVTSAADSEGPISTELATAYATFSNSSNAVPTVPTGSDSYNMRIGRDPPKVVVSSIGVTRDTDFTSPDTGIGRAITTVNPGSPSLGDWQYKLVGTALWVNMSMPTSGSALLLSAEDTVRFMANTAGTSSNKPSLVMKAWDEDSGVSGVVVVTSTVGALSTDDITLEVEVLAANNRPTITGSPMYNVQENAQTIPVLAVSDIGTTEDTDLTPNNEPIGRMITDVSNGGEPRNMAIPGFGSRAVGGSFCGCWTRISSWKG